MYIKQLTATFGRLDNQQLSLREGLNIIEAPNEQGKSTWAALLRALFYGINTRDRSLDADKRRYMPWSGSPMQGVMEAHSHLGDITVSRSTQRATSPMGSFSAVFTGTATPVPQLTAANCGEMLLGVPQEVYERSAYIRQSGITVDQNPALERRIAALITTGEEDISYTDAAARLKKQLTRRRYNKSGLLPQLEQDIRSLETLLSEIDSLQQELATARLAQKELEDQKHLLHRQLHLHDLADAAQAAQAAAEAKAAAEEKEIAAENARRETLHLPDTTLLEKLRGSLDALRSMQQTILSARDETVHAQLRLQQARKNLSCHPLGGCTPQEASQLPLDEAPRPTAPRWAGPAAVAAGAALAAALHFCQQNWLAVTGAGLGLAGALLIAISLPILQKQKLWDHRHRQLTDERAAQLTEHAALWRSLKLAEDEYQAAQTAQDRLERSYRDALSPALAQVALFSPDTSDLSGAAEAIDTALVKKHRAEELARNAAAARARWEILAENAPPPPAEVVQRPEISRSQLQNDLLSVSSKLETLQQRILTLQGRAGATGDPLQLQSQMEEKDRRRARLQAEYDAIAIAGEVLDHSNSRLQNRFSPALGEMSAKIFTKLTKGKYNKVLLDRAMTPSAQETDQFLPREASTLSLGASHQLYLAVRLAICQMALPDREAAPILLDDALVTFDDERCAAALDYLMELSQQRQILLFTCQSRESAYLSRAYPGQFHTVSL